MNLVIKSEDRDFLVKQIKKANERFTNLIKLSKLRNKNATHIKGIENDIDRNKALIDRLESLSHITTSDY